jgi:hypothetical protein
VRFLKDLLIAGALAVALASDPCFAQPAKVLQSDFVLDTHHPYVYLQIDHLGQRAPMQPGESGRTIWLRVVNNCKMSILFPTFGKLNEDEGDTVPDRVIPNEPMFEIIASPVVPETTSAPSLNATIDKDGVHTQKEQITQVRMEKPDLKAKEPLNIPPGYEFVFLGETPVHILSGQSRLVGIPVEHVSKNWFARLEFALNLGNYWNQPRTNLDLSWWDLPESVRSELTKANDQAQTNSEKK